MRQKKEQLGFDHRILELTREEIFSFEDLGHQSIQLSD